VNKKYIKKRNSTAKKVSGEDFTVTLHPLFFLFGVYYAVIGKIFLFLTITISAVLHELGHAYLAKKNGYVLSALTLMPYGASISGNLDGLKNKDEILIAIGGPLVSLFIAFFTAGLWWFFPDSYPFTEVIYDANLTLFLVNLIPIKPLDGGRILSAVFSSFFGEKIGRKTFCFLGYLFSFLLLFVFALSIIKSKQFAEINFSLLFFALFIFFGVLEEKKTSPYKKASFNLSIVALKRGVEVKKKAVLSSITIKRLLSLMDSNAYNEFEVVDKGVLIKQNTLVDNLVNLDIYSKLSDNLTILKTEKY
jgi:stage IV sporulation protein FB